jgi:hypothetical protein
MRIMIAFLVPVLLSFPAQAGDLGDALAAIKSVKREGDGNEKAAAAWKIVVKHGSAALPHILAAYDGANATTANWFRSAVDAIAENEQTAGRKLSAEMLEAFVNDTQRDPRARHLAFELLVQTDVNARKRLLPGLIDDTGAGLRREAVAYAMELGNALGKDADSAKRAHFLKLFDQARDADQVETIAKKLKEFGAGEADVIGHLGLITRWQIAGPFDNAKLKGFAAPLPAVEKWNDHATGHARALVDLYQALGKAKGVKDGKKDAVYALCRTEFDSPTEGAAEIRAATEDAVKIYFNGKEVFSREEYHHGRNLDAHVAPVTLRKGRNEIVLKICQDDLTYDWTVDWSFQCRVCDAIGGSIPLTFVTAPNAVPVKPEPPKPAPAKPEPPKEKK